LAEDIARVGEVSLSDEFGNIRELIRKGQGTMTVDKRDIRKAKESAIPNWLQK